MNELKLFQHETFGDVRVVEQNGEPWFVASDVCKCLDIGNTGMAVGRLDEDEKGIISTDTLGGKQSVTIISESGLYSLVLGSRKPEAKAFKRWITHEVIPAIRKHGAYMTPKTVTEMLANPDGLIKLLQAFKAEHEGRMEAEKLVEVKTQQIAELQPKATYYDLVLQCKDVIPITTIAKDFGMAAKGLNLLLNEWGIQYKLRDTWLLYAEYQDKGYTQSKSTVFPDKQGNMHTSTNTQWTQKGRLFLYEVLKKHGYLPNIEKDGETYETLSCNPSPKPD